jgi:hypothetical protein
MNEIKIDKDFQFIYNLDGLIKGEYVRIQTDFKEVILKILEIMD